MYRFAERFSTRDWMSAAAITAVAMLTMSLLYSPPAATPNEAALQSELSMEEEAAVLKLFSTEIVPQVREHYEMIKDMSEEIQ